MFTREDGRPPRAGHTIHRAMKLQTLRDALIHELRDLHSAETQLVKALPKMAKAATHEELVEAFESHLEETKEHVERLDRIFEMLDVSSRGEKCKAMEGLIAEGEKTIKEDAEESVHDALLIAAAQRVEHYEIAGYGTARTFAAQVGEKKIADLLQQTLDEESEADEKLTEIAESVVNAEAESAA